MKIVQQRECPQQAREGSCLAAVPVQTTTPPTHRQTPPAPHKKTNKPPFLTRQPWIQPPAPLPRSLTSDSFNSPGCVESSPLPPRYMHLPNNIRSLSTFFPHLSIPSPSLRSLLKPPCMLCDHRLRSIVVRYISQLSSLGFVITCRRHWSNIYMMLISSS